MEFLTADKIYHIPLSHTIPPLVVLVVRCRLGCLEANNAFDTMKLSSSSCSVCPTSSKVQSGNYQADLTCLSSRLTGCQYCTTLAASCDASPSWMVANTRVPAYQLNAELYLASTMFNFSFFFFWFMLFFFWQVKFIIMFFELMQYYF